MKQQDHETTGFILRSGWDHALCPTGLPSQTLRDAIMRSMMGCKMTSIANPIFPPGTTMVLRRLMKES